MHLVMLDLLPTQVIAAWRPSAVCSYERYHTLRTSAADDSKLHTVSCMITGIVLLAWHLTLSVMHRLLTCIVLLSVL